MKTRVLAICLAVGFSMPALADNVSDGGMSGGGGGTGPVQAVTQKEVIQAIELSKMVATGWFNQLEFLYRINDDGYWARNYPTLGRPPKAILVKMFDNPKKAVDVINQIIIDGRTGSACFDKSGKRVDGSIYGKQPNSICMSIARLQKKLNDATLEKQVTALIIHEIMHLLGGNEQEAKVAQNYALASFRVHNRIEVFQKISMRVTLTAQKMQEVFGWLTPQSSATELCHYADIIQSQCGDINLAAFNHVYSYSPLTWEQFLVVDRDLFAAVGNLKKSLCGQTPAPFEAVRPQINLMKDALSDFQKFLWAFSMDKFQVTITK